MGDDAHVQWGDGVRRNFTPAAQVFSLVHNKRILHPSANDDLESGEKESPGRGFKHR